jgi:hypothetical protein
MPVLAHTCPDCDEPLVFVFSETSGLSAWKRGDAVNTTADTWHYVCFSCAKAWKQRLSGPLTGDVVGDLAFFSCRRPECGATMAVTRESTTPTAIALTCAAGHHYGLNPTEEGGLTVEERTG